MKTREQVEHIEEEAAYDHTRTFYVCEGPGCGFESEEQDGYENHYGLTHAPKEARTVNGREFVRFDTKEDKALYVKAKSGSDELNMSGWYDGDWEGPGWYGFEGRNVPCGRGCCTNYEETLRPVSYFEEQLKEKRDEAIAALDQIQPLLKT